ncbi:MAG: hypothetical protein QM808_00620 [Steroidobacteraceae bacterium]
MLLIARCERAFVHDVKNSLQPLHACVDSLIRMSSAPTAAAERIVEFSRQALTQHTQTLDGLIGSLVAAAAPPLLQDINPLVQKAVSFLRYDALQRGVRIELKQCESANAVVTANKLRWVLLALLVDAIDAALKGESVAVCTEAHDRELIISVRGARHGAVQETEFEDIPQLDVEHLELPTALVLPVVRNWVAAEQGRVECESGSGQRCVRVMLPLSVAT